MSKVKTLKISDLVPDDKNANLGTERGTGMLETSLREFGAGRSILLDKNNRIIAGNKTTEGAVSIGLSEDVIVVETDGTKLVAVKRTDLDMDTDAQARGLAVADNRLSEVNLNWDGDVLAEMDEMGVDLNQFWFEGELHRVLDGPENTSLGTSSTSNILQPDNTPSPSPKSAIDTSDAEQFAIVVICESEAELDEAFDELQQQGYRCRKVRT